jgi:hypothetical protein
VTDDLKGFDVFIDEPQRPKSSQSSGAEPRKTNGHDDEPPPPNGPEDYGLFADAEIEEGEADRGDRRLDSIGETGTKRAHKDQPKRDMPRAWWHDPASIPPRSSLYDGHYIRRTIGATIGGGGRAKTTRGIYEGISMAVGFDIATKDKLPDGKLQVWICNGEEEQDELDRRVAAACQRYNVSEADLGGRLFVQSVRDAPLRIATLVNNRPVIDETVKKYMVAFIERNDIDVFMIDPLVSFHGVLENDNSHMDLVIKEGFGAIANRTSSAGELFHHPGKPRPGQAETTVEDGRGASSILWAVRSARVFNFMTPEEAAKLGLSEDERRLHIRITNGKANAGPLGKAKWMRLVVENLANGDAVAVASPWSPPDPFKNVTTADMELARKLAATGEYRADMRSPKWLGYATNFCGVQQRHGVFYVSSVGLTPIHIRIWTNQISIMAARSGCEKNTPNFLPMKGKEEGAPILAAFFSSATKAGRGCCSGPLHPPPVTV